MSAPWDGYVKGLGTVSYTVGNGGNFPDIQTAITAVGSRITNRISQTTVVTATNGSPTITLGVWPTGHVLWVGDLWKPDANSRYYKIKALNSVAQTITLWENFADTTISGVSTAWSTFYLNRTSLMLLPGFLISNAAILQPGFDLIGLNQHGMALAENQSVNPYPITNFGENHMIGIGFAPVPGWGDMDHMVGPSGAGAISPTLWAGADSFIENCYVLNSDLTGIHAGGSLQYPVLNGGRITYRNCVFRSSRTPSSASGGAVTATAANTTVIMDVCRFESTFSNETQLGSELIPSCLLVDALATYKLISPVIDMPDRAMADGFALVGGASGIQIGSAATAQPACVVDIHDPHIRVTNTGTAVCYGIDIEAPATVNIHGADVEAAGTSSTGLFVNNVGSTVNIRGGCRLKGGTNSVNNVTGTVNKSTSQPPILIGAAAGVITALDT